MPNIILLAFLWAALSTAHAQSIGQIGVSAASGSAAGAAGQTVSDGFDSVMNKAGGLLESAAKTGKPKEKKKGRVAQIVPPEPRLDPVTKTAKPPAPAAPVATRKPAFLPKPAPKPDEPLVLAVRQAEPPQQAAPPVRGIPPPELVSAQLPQVEIGTSRQELIGRLGKPAGKITSVDERGLVEVYSFRDGRAHAGSIRLVNGKVAEVRLAQ